MLIRLTIAGFEDGRREPRAKKCKQPSAAQEDKEIYSPIRASRKEDSP